ncbi:hypothetical protein DFJ74DRAFT_667855 [Hyaloraphidium curvatum]|nr:hypothetical protein DFJ74DRAFT_667855 [Hyaloraphidium curvatum]
MSGDRKSLAELMPMLAVALPAYTGPAPSSSAQPAAPAPAPAGPQPAKQKSLAELMPMLAVAMPAYTGPAPSSAAGAPAAGVSPSAPSAPASEEYPRGTRLAGKVALISGASRGLGASHARAIVAQGGKVVIADVAACDEGGKALAKGLGAENAEYVTLDVRDREGWKKAVERTVQRFGKLNVLILNAGIVNWGTADVYTYEQWDDMIAINLTGVFNGLRASVDALKASAPASVIMVSSTAGLQGYGVIPGYVAAKHGVRGLAKSAALSLAPYGIRVNSLHPGMIESPMTADLPKLQKHVALKRAGKAHELSKMVVFLASDESSYSTGAEFVADGGETAGLAMDWNA